MFKSEEAQRIFSSIQVGNREPSLDDLKVLADEGALFQGWLDDTRLVTLEDAIALQRSGDMTSNVWKLYMPTPAPDAGDIYYHLHNHIVESSCEGKFFKWLTIYEQHGEPDDIAGLDETEVSEALKVFCILLSKRRGTDYTSCDEHVFFSPHFGLETF